MDKCKNTQFLQQQKNSKIIVQKEKSVLLL